MAVGDAVVLSSSVASGAYLALQPGAGVEWAMHNLYHSHNVELDWYNGTTSLAFNTITTGQGEETNKQHHCTNSLYVRMKNTDASTRQLGADGMQTK